MIYLNNASLSYPKPEKILSKWEENIRLSPISAHIGYDNVALKSKNLLHHFFSGRGSEHFFLCPSATWAANIIFNGLKKENKKIIVDRRNHNAVLRTLFSSEYKSKIQIIGYENNWFSEIERETDAESIVFINMTSNVTGFTFDLEKLKELRRRKHFLLILDISQAAGVLDIDLTEIDIAFSALHKFMLGPEGIAFFYLDNINLLDPVFFGGTGNWSSVLDYSNKKIYEIGSASQRLLTDLEVSLEYMNTNKTCILEKIRAISDLIRVNLRNLDFIQLLDDKQENKGACISFSLDGLNANDLEYILSASFDIIGRSGLLCAPLTFANDGEGTMRVSPSAFTTLEDVEYLVKALYSIYEARI